MLIKFLFPDRGACIYSRSSLNTVLVLVFMFVMQVSKSQPAAITVSTQTKDLFNAIRSGSSAELEKQLANGASVNDSLNGYSALMAAALSGTAEQMKLLIDRGANVNFVSQPGITALWLAVPDINKIKLLLDRGAEINHLVQGYGILVKLAAMPGTINSIKLLVDQGADLRKSAPDNSLVYNAAQSGDTTLLGFFLRNGCNAKDTIVYGDYPINGALFYRNSAIVKMLVENGADVNVSSKAFQLPAFNGFTPLMYAALNNDKPSFYYLLEHGADPNMKNSNGYTALMLLQQMEEDDPAMTKALLDHGAEPSIKTPAGNDALHFAMQKGNTQSVALLKKYTK